MIRGHRKLSTAVWFYFLLAATMETEQHLSLHNNQDGTQSQDQKLFDVDVKGGNYNIVSDDSPRLELYGVWSPWTVCHPRSCTQIRSKHCRPGANCAGSVLKEERPCPKSDELRRRKHCDKGNQRGRKHRHKKREPHFHVVVNNNRKTVQKIGARSGDLVGRWAEDKDTDNEVTLRGEYKRAYSRWSRWTICTKSCTTQRYRWCKRPAICGKDVIRETAFCYQEGSHCHNIHQDMMRRGTDDNNIYNDRAATGTHSFSLKPISVNSPLLQSVCGVVTNFTSRGSYTGNMLRIIGGHPSQPGRWPWQVALLNRFKEAFCGGTLIAAQWVLTAAHCVRKRLYVRLGEHDLVEKEGTELEMRVEYAVTHPQYNIDTVDNDLALLHLPVVVEMDQYRGIACLPRPRQPLPTRRLCTIIGWGKRRNTDMFGTDILQEAQVPIVSNEVCRGVYEDYHITGNMFCAGDRRGRTDSCAGDSGGPLLCRDHYGRWTVFGITSFGEGCGKRGKYGIYTRLPNYVRWVHRVMKTYTTV